MDWQDFYYTINICLFFSCHVIFFIWSINTNERGPSKLLSKVNEKTSFTVNQPLTVRVNPPPIYLNDVQNYKELVAFLQIVGSNIFKLKLSTRGVSVYPDTAVTYSLMVARLRQAEASCM